MNATMEKFGWPETILRDFTHWALLLRRAQPTLGSLILAAKSSVVAFGDLPPEAHAELALVTRTIESALKRCIQYERINYLMLMMVDPHVHFHVLPRYEGRRTLSGLTIEDAGWPGPPRLTSAFTLDGGQTEALLAALSPYFSQCSSPPNSQ